MTRRRRDVLAGGAALCALSGTASGAASVDWKAALAGMEREIGGDARIGVRMIDPVGRHELSYRANERFPMCSTFKLLLVGMVLHRVDRGSEHLDRAIGIPARSLANAPVTQPLAGRTMTVRDLCAAAMTRSDNVAANLLLQSVGGPPALTRFLRGTGDGVTRLDRFELDLNAGTPGDPRDTSTPSAMLDTTRRLATGRILSASARERLVDWMLRTETGVDKLRKGLPIGWQVADRTGAGGHNSNNDIALIWPAGRPASQPLFVASMTTGGPGDDPLSRNPVHARIGRLIAEAVAS